MAKIKDLTGKKFGKLTAIEPTDLRSNTSVIWRCKCDCGKYTTAAARDLQNNRSKSCGCLPRARKVFT